MGKVSGSWSGMRNYLEREMLCDNLRGRVRYICTTYPNMDGCGHFEIFVDDKSAKIFSMDHTAGSLRYDLNSAEGLSIWRKFWFEKANTPLEERREFDDEEFAEALKVYRCLNINDSLHSKNPIVRMFAILDRRVGKRTLKSIAKTVYKQPEWLQFFYNLRLTAENIT